MAYVRGKEKVMKTKYLTVNTVLSDSLHMFGSSLSTPQRLTQFSSKEIDVLMTASSIWSEDERIYLTPFTNILATAVDHSPQLLSLVG